MRDRCKWRVPKFETQVANLEKMPGLNPQRNQSGHTYLPVLVKWVLTFDTPFFTECNDLLVLVAYFLKPKIQNGRFKILFRFMINSQHFNASYAYVSARRTSAIHRSAIVLHAKDARLEPNHLANDQWGATWILGSTDSCFVGQIHPL